MDFLVSQIDDKLFAKIHGLSYKDNCPIPLNELRYLHILHRDIEGKTHAGGLVANVFIVHTLADIFYKLYEASYPIEKVHLIDEYSAIDEISMQDNNSSCFNFRFISHTKKISKHGYGLAVDINPLYNPYVKTVNGKLSVEPSTAEAYLNRDKDFPYKIAANDLCCRLFLEHGFEWGGSWEGKKDYQHFEVSDKILEMLYPVR